MNLVHAQETRRILDRLAGYTISPLLWKKISPGLSAGRVQSVAVEFLVDRERERMRFRSGTYYDLKAELSKLKDKANFNADLSHLNDKRLASGKDFDENTGKLKKPKSVVLLDEEKAAKLRDELHEANWAVSNVDVKQQKRNPSPAFITSTLQQEANRKLGFSARDTMSIAQKLYERGLITYMRTDSVRIAPESLSSLREFIQKKYGKDYLPSSPNEYKKKGSNKVQDAHEAIRPTSLTFTPDEVRGDLEPDQQKLYELIWNKFVSSQMGQAIIDQTSVTFENSGHFFKCSGSIIKFPGFRTVYLEAAAEKASKRGGNDDEDEIQASAKAGLLPELKEGESIKAFKEAKELEHWTSPPPRYNEASIVKEMEEQGIGRPSTYASIISNIQDRGYVEKIENRFVPTELGQVVCKMLVQSFPDVMNVKFTAGVEELLDKIEEGEIGWKKVLKDFWSKFEVTLEKAKEEMKNLKKQLIPTGINCKKCEDGEYHIKWGRNGQFLACSNYPDCNSTHDFKKDLEGTIHILPKNYFHDPCPTCGKRLEVKTGRYGRFVRCEDYPHCETTLPYTLPIVCPDCKIGKFAEKKSRYGKYFYGCTNYPECTNALWSRPYKNDCPSCGYAIMGYRETKREGKQLQCPKCKFKVDWEDTKFGKEEAAKQKSEEESVKESS
jgi:DNA topoisomerase-1